MKNIKNNVPLLSCRELDAFFVYADAEVKTKQEICFELHESNQVTATYNLSFDEGKGINIDLVVDYDNVEQLITAHQLKACEELNKITVADLWLRYLRGDGFVCCDIDELAAEICFRVVKGITMVYSADLSFFQEIIHVLYDDTETSSAQAMQFKKYIDENMHRFGVAVVMRPMLLPGKLWLP